MKYSILIGLISCFSGIAVVANASECNSPEDLFSEEGNRWDLFADLLVWSPQEVGSCWAFVLSPLIADPPAAPFQGEQIAALNAVSFAWNVGIRTGVGYTMNHDQWDTQLFYTWFQTTANNQLTASPETIIQSEFFGSGYLLHNPDYNEANIQWHILFDMFDWELGRKFGKTDSLFFRHFLGIKGGWIHQDIHAKWINVDFQGTETFKHHFWGVGPKIGIDGAWNLVRVKNHQFSLFADFETALMWGHWSLFSETLTGSGVLKKLFDLPFRVITQTDLPSRSLGSLMFHALPGISYDVYFKNNKAHFSLKCGYEIQIWLEQLQLFQQYSGFLHDALILQGGTFRFNFAF